MACGLALGFAISSEGWMQNDFQMTLLMCVNEGGWYWFRCALANCSKWSELIQRQALAVFLMYWVVIAGGRRDVTACGMRVKMSCASQFLATPAAQLQCGGWGRGGEAAGEMAPLCAAACSGRQALTHQLEGTSLGSRLSSDYILLCCLCNCYLFTMPLE